MSVMQYFRVIRSRAFAIRLREELERQEFPGRPHDIDGLIKPKWVLSGGSELITTEIGFVTMTVLPTLVHYCREMVLIPGCDDTGNRGYLVFRPNRLPFHSLATNSRDAYAEVLAAHRRADALIGQFGSKDALKLAVRSAPWHQWCNVGDAYNAGLCEWGVRSFLGRYKIRRIGCAVGLPSGLLRLAGSYGERITAAAMVRGNRIELPVSV